MFSAASGLASLISGNRSNPAKKANKYLDQIPGTITPYYQNYIDAGQNSLNQLTDQFSQLMSDPSAIMNMLGQNFQKSPGYDWQVSQAQGASNNAAAAGGMLGSPQHQYNSANMVNNLANQDYYNYFNNALGLYNTGLQGASGINQMGYGASNELAQSLANVLMSKANLSYEGQAAKNKGIGTAWGDIISGLMF